MPQSSKPEKFREMFPFDRPQFETDLKQIHQIGDGLDFERRLVLERVFGMAHGLLYKLDHAQPILGVPAPITTEPF